LKTAPTSSIAALMTFVLTALLAVAATVWQTQRNQAEAEQRFEALSQRSAEQVLAQMRRYEFGLRGARGAMLGAGVDDLTRRRFSDYSASRDIRLEFPGARGFGIIKRVTAREQAAFVAAARRDGWPDFELRQLAPQPNDRFVIQYVEPLAHNRDAIGLDIASEHHRLEAVEAAMRSGHAALTRPITLVQAAGSPQGAFLILLPIYRPGKPLASMADREAALVGLSFAPLVVEDVLKNVDLADDTFTLSLRDAETAPSSLQNFFASPGADLPAVAGLSRHIEIPIYGRTWIAETRATPAFLRGLQQVDPHEVALGGLGLTLLMTLLAYVLSQNAMRARLVSTEQARHSAIVESSADAIIGESLDGIVTDWNRGAERLFGYAASVAIGRSAASLLLPPECEGEDADIRRITARGESVPPFDTTRRRSDGALVAVSIAAAPILTAQGQCIGFSKTVRDISESQRMQQALVELNTGLERQVADRTAALNAALHDLRAIIDAVPSMIAYWDRHLINRVVNRAYSGWFGLEPEAVQGRHMSYVFGEALFERSQPLVQAALRGERQSFEHSAPRADGSGMLHSLIQYLPDVLNGQVKGFYVLVHDISELTENRLRLAAAQRDNSALLKALHLQASIIVTDCGGRIIEVNDKFCQISGYSREELLGQTPSIVNSGVHEPGFWADMWITVAAGGSWRNEACNRAKDGTLYWMDCTVSPFFGEDGQIEKFISIRTDITARKRFEAELHLINERFEIASGSAGIGVWEYDTATETLSWDRRMYEIYGCPELFGQEPYALWRQRLHPEDRAHIKEEMAQAFAGERELDIEFRTLAPDGEVRHLRAASRVMRDAQGRALRMIGVNFDVTKRVRAELDLRETSTLLKTVLASASEVSIIATDPQFVISVFNAGAERLLGYTSEEVVGRTTPILIHDREEVEARGRELSAQLGRRVAGTQVFAEPSTLGQPHEWTFIGRQGQRVPVSQVVTPMRDPSGALFGYLGIAHDVSRQKQHEDSLREAVDKATQANSAKSQFLANMSHEIRTPMNAILGMLTLVQRTELNARQLDYIGKTEAAAKSLLGLLNDILDFSKVEAGKMELDPRPFQLDAVLRNLAVILSANVGNKDLEVLFDIDPEVPRDLVGDDLRLQQILINLGGNAVKFTAQGEVVIGVRRVPGPAGESRAHLAHLEFSVRDTGIGISPEHQARIFSGFTQAEASTTRRFGGTGLGLAICQRLVGLMGGELALQSVAGAGTTFFFTLALPLSTVLDPSQTPALPRPGERQGRRALVVDDHQIARDLLQGMAQSLGWQTDAASSGEAALVSLAAAQAQGAPYDVVFMDWQMPGLDGWQTCQRIREMERPGTVTSVVVMVTANGREALAQRGDQGDKLIDGFLVKPVTCSMLLDAVAQATQGGGGCAVQGARRLEGMRLLLAEDNVNNQQIAVELLEAEGAVVQIAGDGSEAVAAVAGAAQPFDAVLMDLQMPEMDGFEATSRIRGWLGQASLPIIAMTANAMASDREACLAAGMDGHVGKPFDLAELIDVLLHHTGRGRTDAAQAPPQDGPAEGAVPAGVLAEAQRRGVELAAALARVGGNDGAYLRMLRSFLEEAAGVPDQLTAHLAAGEGREAARLMHTMKGLAGTLGVPALVTLTARAEVELADPGQALARAGDAPWLASLRDTFAQACTHLAWAAEQLRALKSQGGGATAGQDAGDPGAVLQGLLDQLDQLAALLRESDMAAMDLYAQIDDAHGGRLGERGQPLDAAMSALDFERALAHCQELSGALGGAAQTRTP
jgi:PAS domain S-box-containing protein